MSKHRPYSRKANNIALTRADAARISESRASSIHQAQRAHDKWLAELLGACLVGATPENRERLQCAIARLKERADAGAA